MNGRNFQIAQVFEEEIPFSQEEFTQEEITISVVATKTTDPILSIVCSLNTVARSPYHHDLIIDWPRGKKKEAQGRICYDFKVQQISNVKFRVSDVKCVLSEPLN